jgi:hypothetical protein
LRRAFAIDEECLTARVYSSHPIAQAGDYRRIKERHFIDFLRKFLPDRYAVETGIVIDSEGKVSDPIDVVVFEREATPTLLDHGGDRYIPAETVYAVFECSLTVDKECLEKTAHMAAAVRGLRRTSVAIDIDGGPTRLFGVVAGILAIEVAWPNAFQGGSFESLHALLTGDRSIECGFAAKGASFDTFAEGGGYTLGPTNNTLGFFAFRLLSKLQSLGPIAAVDWAAYAAQFNRRTWEM